MGETRNSGGMGRDAAYREWTKKGGKGRNPCLLVLEPCYEVRLFYGQLFAAAVQGVGEAILYPGKFMR